MNTPNRHMRYRRSVYRRRNIRITLIAAVCIIAVLAIVFIIIGNALGNKVEQNNSTPTTDTQSNGNSVGTEVKQVNAYPVALSESGSTLSNRLARVQNKGYTHICFDLDTANGTLQYISDLATSLGKQQGNTQELRTLDNIVGLFRDDGLYSIGIAHINEYKSDNDLIRSAAIGYHAAQIAEALRKGVDDVLIYVGEVSPDRYKELIHLAEEVRRLCSDGVIGIAIPTSLLSDSTNMEHKELIYKLSQSFDYMAADLSTTEANGTGTSLAEQVDSELGKMLLYLLQYKMRVLLPYSDDENVISSLNSAVANRDIKNVQIMPSAK